MSWKDEFDAKFPEECFPRYLGSYAVADSSERIKVFITDLIEKERKEAVKEYDKELFLGRNAYDQEGF